MSAQRRAKKKRVSATWLLAYLRDALTDAQWAQFRAEYRRKLSTDKRRIS